MLCHDVALYWPKITIPVFLTWWKLLSPIIARSWFRMCSGDLQFIHVKNKHISTERRDKTRSIDCYFHTSPFFFFLPSAASTYFTHSPMGRGHMVRRFQSWKKFNFLEKCRAEWCQAHFYILTNKIAIWRAREESKQGVQSECMNTRRFLTCWMVWYFNISKENNSVSKIQQRKFILLITLRPSVLHLHYWS